MDDEDRRRYAHPPWWLLGVMAAADTVLIVLIGQLTRQPVGLLIVEWIGALAVGAWLWWGASRPR